VPEFSEPRRLRQTLRILDGDFVRTQRHGGLEVVGFANPSLRDFVVGRLRDDPQRCRRLLDRARYFDQVSLLAGYSLGDAIKQEHVAALRRTVESESCVVETIQSPGGQIRGSVAAPIIESRLTTALEAGGPATMKPGSTTSAGCYGIDGRNTASVRAATPCWRCSERRFISRSSRNWLGACAMHCSAGSRAVMRRGCGVGWWRITRTLAQASKKRASAEFHAFADAEVDALAQSKNEDEIEEGREDLKELANKFGCDFDAINMMAVDEQLDGLARYALRMRTTGRRTTTRRGTRRPKTTVSSMTYRWSRR